MREDQPIEIEEVAASAQRSRVRSRERPPAVVLRGRAVIGVGHHHHVIQDIIELPHLSLLNHNNDLRESHCLTDLSCLILQSLHIQRSALTDRVLGLRPHQHVELSGQILHSQLFPYHQILLVARGTRTNGRKLFGGILLQDIRSL